MIRGAVVLVLALAGSGCTLMIGWEPNRDPRWRYPDCSAPPVVGVPTWLCAPPWPCDGEQCPGKPGR